MTGSRSTLHRALTHPLVKAAKVPLKNALWRARGRGLSNPPLPRRVQSILFVCKGNICRSPFAGLRAAQLVADAGVTTIHSASAGISTSQAGRAPREACEAATAFGLSLDAHEPLQLTRELLTGYDITVVMEAEQLTHLRTTYPDAAGRLFLLSLLDDEAAAGYEQFNIADPYSQPLAAFHQCYARIDRAIRRLLSDITGQAAGGGANRREPRRGDQR